MIKNEDTAIEKVQVIDGRFFVYQSGLKTIRICEFKTGKQIHRLRSRLYEKSCVFGFGKLIIYKDTDAGLIFISAQNQIEEFKILLNNYKTHCIFQDKLIIESSDGKKHTQIYDLKTNCHLTSCEDIELDPSKLSMMAIHNVFTKAVIPFKHEDGPSLLDLVSGKTIFVDSNNFDIPLENQDPIFLTCDEYCIALYYEKSFIKNSPEDQTYQIKFTLDIQHLAIANKALTPKKCNEPPKQDGMEKANIKPFRLSKTHAAILFPVLFILYFYFSKTKKPV